MLAAQDYQKYHKMTRELYIIDGFVFVSIVCGHAIYYEVNSVNYFLLECIIFFIFEFIL